MQPKMMKALAALFLLVVLVGCGTDIVSRPTVDDNPSYSGGGNSDGNVLVLQPGITYPVEQSEFTEEPVNFSMSTPPSRSVSLAELNAHGFQDVNNVLKLDTNPVTRTAKVAQVCEQLAQMRKYPALIDEMLAERQARRVSALAAKNSSAVHELLIDLSNPYWEGSIGTNGAWWASMFAVAIQGERPTSYSLTGGEAESWIGWSNYSQNKWEWTVATASQTTVVNLDDPVLEHDYDRPFSRYDQDGGICTAWIVVVRKIDEPAPVKLVAKVADNSIVETPNAWAPTNTFIGLKSQADKGSSYLNEDQDVLLEFAAQQDWDDLLGSDRDHIFGRGPDGGGTIYIGDVLSNQEWFVDDDSTKGSSSAAIPGETYAYANQAVTFAGGLSGSSGYNPAIQVPLLFTTQLSNPLGNLVDSEGHVTLRWNPVLYAEATSYVLYRNGVEMTTVAAESLDLELGYYEYKDETPVAGQVNLYTARVVNAYATSVDSNIVRIPYFPKTRITGFGFDCSQGPTALAYKSTGEPMVIFTDTAEGVTDLKIAIATSDEPAATSDFAVSTIASNTGSVYRLEMVMYGDDSIFVVYATDAGLKAAVSIIGPDGPEDWTVTTIDGSSLAKAGQWYLAAALVNGNPAVVYNQNDYTQPPIGMYYVSSSVARPDSDDDWVSRHCTGINGIGLDAQLTLVAINGKPALGVCPRTGSYNEYPQVRVANVSNPVSSDDWNDIVVDVYSAYCLGLGLQVEGTVLKAVVVPTSSTDVGAGLTSADSADGFIGWPDESLVPAAVVQSQRGWCKLLQINDLPMVCTYRVTGGGSYGLSFSTIAAPASMTDWAQDSSPWYSTPSSQSVAQGTNQVAFGEVMPNTNDLRFTWIAGNT